MALKASDTLGFTEVSAGRGVTVDVGTDPNGLLGLTGLSDPNVTPVFSNQSASTMDITLDATEDSVEWDVGNDGNYVGDPVWFTLASGGSTRVAARGSDTVTFDATAILQSGGTRKGRITLTRSLAASQADLVREVSGTASSAGRSGKYEFDLQNTGDIDVTIVGVGIRETTNRNAVRVADGGILTADGTQVVSSPIPVDSSQPDQDTRVNLDQNVSLGSGSSRTFEFDKFRTRGGGNGNGGGNPNADMRGADVRVRLYFEDGSAGTVDLCIGGCDF